MVAYMRKKHPRRQPFDVVCGSKEKDVMDISIIWVMFFSSGHKQGKSLCPGLAFISSTAGIVMAVPAGNRSTLRRPTFKSSVL